MPIKRYDKFGGVDYSMDATQIDATRSPDARNIIPDSGGYPEKRVGWRTIEEFDNKINGIFTINDETIIHAGDKMYRMGDEPEVLMSGVNNAKSFGIVFGEKLWILTGREYLCYPHEVEKKDENNKIIYINSMVHVRDIATVPQVLSQTELDTNREITGGIFYQPFNLLTPKRKIGVTLRSGTEILVKQPTAEAIKVTSTISWKSVVKSRTDQSSGGYWSGKKITLRTDSANAANNMPEETYNLPDGIIMEYEPMTKIQIGYNFSDEMKEQIVAKGESVAKNREMIEKCTFAAIYENRLFLSGNPDYPNTDFYSELNDPTYFADVNYTGIGTSAEVANETEVEEREKNYVGTGGTKIMGYSYVGNYLAIHKDGGDNGASIYLRTSSMTEDGMIFPIKEGIMGESIVSHNCCVNFIDDPVFLTKSGVYAVASADITSERSLQSRSTRVNNKLTNEKNLENAVTCVWNGYLMLFVNGNVYVADSRQKSYPRNISNTFEYEWYFWDSIPATVVKAMDDTVYFGTEDGKLCRFNNDMKDSRGGYLMSAYNDDGSAIHARWSTKMDDDGDFSVSKIMRRRGGGVYVKSYSAGDITLSVRTEQDFGRLNSTKRIGIFNFKDVNFENFTFNTLPFSFVPFARKVKDYRIMQVIVENNKPNQCMGVVAIERNYATGGFAK